MYGIVMAGGLSSRMGRNKLRLSIHGDGKDMLERTVELLGGFTDGVFVSCRAPEDAAPFKAIPDEVVEEHPRFPFHTLAPEKRCDNFDEVVCGYHRLDAMAESLRCLHCDRR